MQPDPTIEAIEAIAGLLVTEATMDETLFRLLEVARDVVPAADAAGITLVDEHGEPSTPYYSDEISPHVDQAQYVCGRGPCLDAWRERRIVRVDRMADQTDRYPEFAVTATRAGIDSTLSLPLAAGAEGLGALNLYAFATAAFGEEDEVAATRVAGPLGAAVANAAAYWGAQHLADQLRGAMESRAVIEQAKGIVMGSMGCDADAAFDVLRTQSQAENRKLREIAAELVERQPRA